MFSSGKDDWETPDELFQAYNLRYSFVLDAAADEKNHKCDEWLGPGGIHEDALSVSWMPWLEKGNVWLNPPYSRNLQKRFIEKASLEAMNRDANHVVCLLPARTDTKLYHEVIKPYSLEIEFLKGRVKFVGAEHGAPFPSMVVTF